MDTPHLTPAYGRDYRSKKAVIKDFNENKDFLLHDRATMTEKPCNKSQLKEMGAREANIRYDKIRKVVIVRIDD
jgi:hypothetical protein